MASPVSINRHDLLRWADTVAAQTEFPRLLRRLILETGRGVVQPAFPAGEGVSAGGWDGTLLATEAAPYIPAGLSVWELSVEKSSAQAKAEKDYDKRDATPDASPTQACTYVEAILRPWTKRQAWATKQMAEGKWKEVRALGVDDIETWLESAPITHAWISQVLGRNPYGFVPADLWWNAWAGATTPALTPGLVLAGRGAQQEQLVERLKGPAQAITIKAGSLEEVQSFVAAAILSVAAAGDDQLKARAAFVDDLPTWRGLLAHSSPLILVATTEQIRTEPIPASLHHIIIPLVDVASADIELPPIDATEAAAALMELGLEEQRTEKLSRLARRSLLTMRRQLATKRELHEPPWAKPPVDRPIRGLLLAGRWHDGTDGDRRALEALSGLGYDELGEAMNGLATQADPLVGRIDATWSLISAYDAWTLLAPQVRPDDLKRLAPIVQEVLGESNPALELPSGERWRASLNGRTHTHSLELRRGLATTLALLGVYGEQVDSGGGANGVNWAAVAVAKLLNHANSDSSCKVWKSFSGVLPLFAEAAPDAFLAAVTKGLEGVSPLLAGLFEDQGDGSLLGAGSAHTDLLWALEAVAWSGPHLGKAADLLARLAEIDPGGKQGNRPTSSLARIFSPWHPDNSVEVPRQLAVLDALRKRHPAAAWRLMLTMLPKQAGDIHFPSYEPKFRSWKPAEIVVTRPEYFKVVTEVVGRLIEDAGRGYDRWVKLIGRISDLPPADRATVLAGLRSHIEADHFSDAAKAELWESVRSVTARHREFSDTAWALPAEELGKIDQIQAILEPSAPLQRHAWLFQSYRPDLSDVSRRDDFAAYDVELSERRKAAVAEIDTDGGYSALSQLAREATQAWWVGWAIACATEAKYEDELLPLLGADDPVQTALGASFVTRRFGQAGWPWVDGQLVKKSRTPMQRAIVLLQTSDYPRAWQRADELGADVALEFWKRFVPYGLGPAFPDTTYVAERLTGVNRNAAALMLIELYLRRDQSDVEHLLELAATALEALLVTEDPEIGLLRDYGFQQLFSHFFDHEGALGSERIARLEWAYLPALGFDAEPKMLGELLAREPNFFVEIVSAIYRPRSAKDAPPPTPDQVSRAEKAYRLLDNWSTLPGMQGDGHIDGAALEDWVSRAVHGLEAADRLTTGLLTIGQALGRLPSNSDEDWPSLAVRDLLEAQQNEKLDEGIYIGVINSRGVVSRSLGAGGGQERTLAVKFREAAQRYADQWPRTATILRALAERYELDARDEDNSAERFRRGIEE